MEDKEQAELLTPKSNHKRANKTFEQLESIPPEEYRVFNELALLPTGYGPRLKG